MLILSALLACGPACFSQQAEKFPLGDYEELTDTKPHDGVEVWNKMTAPVRFCWGTTDVRYKKLDVPDVKATGTLRLKAWKGERVNAQAVLWTQKDLEGAEMTVSELKNGNSVIPASAVRTHFVRYVMTDELNKDGKGGCGYRVNSEFDSSLVADCIDHKVKYLGLAPHSTRPVWVSVEVPRDAAPGRYAGSIAVKDGDMKIAELKLNIDVESRVLPETPAFHLDLWQNPYAVARYHGVPLFSKEHFEFMRPVMERYADAGGKVITVPVIFKPWNGQTYDPFMSMVTWIRKADGRR